MDVKIDDAGVLYLADGGSYDDSTGQYWGGGAGTSRVRRVAPDGTISTLTGAGTGADCANDGIAAAAACLWGAASLTLDAEGALYIADGGRIRRVSGGIITTHAGVGAGCVDGSLKPSKIDGRPQEVA